MSAISKTNISYTCPKNGLLNRRQVEALLGLYKFFHTLRKGAYTWSLTPFNSRMSISFSHCMSVSVWVDPADESITRDIISGTQRVHARHSEPLQRISYCLGLEIAICTLAVLTFCPYTSEARIEDFLVFHVGQELMVIADFYDFVSQMRASPGEEHRLL